MPRMRPRLSALSDEHLEHGSHDVDPAWFRQDDADIAVLAGDVHRYDRAISFVSRIGLPAVYMPGNHEFYGADMPTARAELARRAERAGVHLLDPGTAVIEIRGVRVRFIGATLWTDYALYGPDTVQKSKINARAMMNDHRLIRYDGRVFTPDDAERLHREQKAYIAEALATPHDGPSVVVTHHAPSIRCQPAQYNDSPIAPAFCSNLEDFVAEIGADVWICGHTHGDCDFTLGKTRVVSNQHGYDGEKPVAMKLIDL